MFSDDERALIGTTYAEEGRLRATRLGLDLVGPRMNRMIDDLKAAVPAGPVLVHCWRGGMRSESVAWLLNFSGQFAATTLRGGYKAFRQFALREFAVRRSLIVLGGMTGSGKTHVLGELQRRGEQVIDLEGLASHKGSAFGAIGLDEQPSQQQFENDFAVRLARTDPERRLWLEDESRRIGRCMLPKEVWAAMRESDCIVLDRPRPERCAHLVADYGRADQGALLDSIGRIERRLGSEKAREAKDLVKVGDMASACEILLDYYDKTYSYGLSRRDDARVYPLAVTGVDNATIANELISFANRMTAGDASSRVLVE